MFGLCSSDVIRERLVFVETMTIGILWTRAAEEDPSIGATVSLDAYEDAMAAASP